VVDVDRASSYEVSVSTFLLVLAKGHAMEFIEGELAWCLILL